MALALVACLAHPDPGVRDGIAFDALSTWMRSDTLSASTLQELSRVLLARVWAAPDAAGFGQPFAALVLAEIARTDRVRPWMSPDERKRQVDAAQNYLQHVRDYRGLDAIEGWRHGVAHGADWAMQWMLNPALSKAQIDQLLLGVASQVVAHGGHAYRFGESQRLAMPLLMAARRNVHTAQEWQEWFGRVSTLPPQLRPDILYQSVEGMAWRHNWLAFLQTLYVQLSESKDDALRQRLLPAVKDALNRLPG